MEIIFQLVMDLNMAYASSMTLIICIAMIYAFFLVKLLDILTDANNIRNATYIPSDDKEYKKRRELLEKVETRLFYALVFFSLVTIVGVLMFQSTLGYTASTGLLAGASILMFYALGSYWNYMNEKFKIILLGVLLVCLVYISIKFVKA